MRCLVAAGVGITLLAATPAMADDQSDPVAAARLAAIVHDRADQDGSLRTATIAALITGGAVSLGVGIPILVDASSRPLPFSNNDQGELLTGTVLTALGGAALLAWPAAFLRTPAEKLDSHIRALRPSPDLLAREETLVATAATEERSSRIAGAVLSFVFSALNVGCVVLDVTTQNQWLGVVNGVASFVGIIGGAVQLAVPGPIEQLWRTWRVGTGRSPVGTRFTPLLGPGGAGFALTF